MTLAQRLDYLNSQIRLCDGETPLTDDDRDMIRERNRLQRECNELCRQADQDMLDNAY